MCNKHLRSSENVFTLQPVMYTVIMYIDVSNSTKFMEISFFYLLMVKFEKTLNENRNLSCIKLEQKKIKDLNRK